ncbi:hypothetical protein SRHO_G00117360 [Serrasalmus rhombeus]
MADIVPFLLSTVADAMKLNPQQAPLYGECVLTVQLSEEEYVEDEEDVEFYLLFAGTTQRHLTTTLRVSHVTLQAVCPAHDCGETVRVTLCQARPGGSVDAVAEERFQYVQDLALDMAHFLLSASGQRDGLERALLLDECQIPLQECERLDETLALALRHIPLPPGWSVLGTDINTNSHTDLGPQETLLHFAARRGLRRVALFLLQQPGGRDALRHQNKQGHTPAGVAQKRGHSQLQHLLSELEDSPCYETKAHRRCSPGGRAFLHHPKLNTYTLTVDTETDVSPPDLRADVEELQRLIQSHQQDKGLSLIEQDYVSLILSSDIGDSSQKTAITSCPGPSLQNPAEHHNAEAKRGNGELLNGTRDYIQSEELEEVGLDCSAREDSGKAAGKGVCAEGREESAAVSGASCGEQQQEEADREEGVFTAEQKEHFSNETDNKTESGNPEEAAMGQSQGLLPSETQPSEESGRSRDLPKEKEGEASSGQETASSSALRQDGLEEGGQKDSKKQADGCCFEGKEVNSLHFGTNEALIGQESPSLSSENITVLEESGRNTSEVKVEGCGQGTEPDSIRFNATFEVNSEVHASQTSKEAVVCLETGDEAASNPKKDTGNHSVKIEAEEDKGFSGSESGSALDSVSLRPNMAPGPIHNVRHEPSPLPDCQKSEEMVLDTTDQDQHQQINQTTVSPAEGASECSEQVRTIESSSDSTDNSEDSAGVHGLSNEENSFRCASESVAAVSSSAVEGNGEMVPAEALQSEQKDEKKASEEGSKTPAGGDHQPMVDLLPVATPNEAQILSDVSEPSSGVSSSGVCEGGSFSVGEMLPGGREDTSPSAEPDGTLSREDDCASLSNEAAIREALGGAEDESLRAEAAVVEASKGVEAASGETEKSEGASSSDEAAVRETSPGASRALSEPQNETELVTDSTNQIQSQQNEALTVDHTQEFLLQLMEPASKPEELSCSSLEATVAIAGNCEAISHRQPAESSETKEDCVKLNEESASLDIGSHVSGSSASPCDSTSKESSSAVSSDAPSEVIASGAEGLVPLPVSPAITVESPSDSGFCLNNTSTADTLSASAQPVEPLDKNSGTVLALDTSSPVDVGSGLSQGLPPSDAASSLGGSREGKSLDEERNRAEEECSEKEKPHEQVADDLSASADVQASLTDMEQTELELLFLVSLTADSWLYRSPGMHARSPIISVRKKLHSGTFYLKRLSR